MNLGYLIACEMTMAATQHELDCLVAWAIRANLTPQEYDSVTISYLDRIKQTVPPSNS